MLALKDLSWQPFDARFKSFLQNFNQHTKTLEKELSLRHATQVLEEFESLQKTISQTEQLVQALRTETSAIEQDRKRREDERTAGRSKLRRKIQAVDDFNRKSYSTTNKMDQTSGMGTGF